MRGNRKRNLLFILIISITISLLLSLSSVLNIVSFRNTYVEATASSNAVVASGTVNTIEYTLKYGKSLDNYYGMEELFEELQELYGYLDLTYIADSEAKVLYASDFQKDAGMPSELKDYLSAALETKQTQIWLEGSSQQMLLPIRDRAGNAIAALGISYDVNMLNETIQNYVDDSVLYTVIAIAFGVCMLILLFFLIRHGFNYKPLLLIVIAVVVTANIVFGITAYKVFSNGYLALTHQTSDIFCQKILSDVDSVVSQGVKYDELEGMDQYFEDLVSRTQELESISLTHGAAGENSEFINTYALAPDAAGNEASLVIEVSQKFVEGKITTILIEIVVSIITALMIAAEVIIFILAALTSKEKVCRLRAKAVVKEADKCCQPVGIVRGLSFFFSMFRYMAMAFVSLVIIDIYRPVTVFGFTLPYELVISLPLTAQMVTSMLGSYISGKISDRAGWKTAACAGIALMAVGSVFSALSKAPLMFVLSQLIFGLGLGVGKTAMDLYAVMVSSEEKMEDFTSGANASCIVGLSCASAIGAIIAGALGYSGAYLVMACMGILVAFMVVIFGQNVRGNEGASEEETDAPAKGKKGAFDLRFISYILFLVFPYYFVIMFVDYLFPVFANTQGVTTAQIGYVFLAYGVATSYIGTFLCRILTKKVRTVLLMGALVLALAAGLGVFSVYNNITLAICMVLLIALCDGIMPSLQFKLVYNLPTTQKIGFSRALGIEGFFTGAISAVAPMVFSFVMTKGNTGFMIASGIVAVCAFLFGSINVKGDKGGMLDA
ncbi:MAG: MFS transporter [Clostridia bacterium]|nr:MFS transporter [Clostridia bacterium]